MNAEVRTDIDILSQGKFQYEKIHHQLHLKYILPNIVIKYIYFFDVLRGCQYINI